MRPFLRLWGWPIVLGLLIATGLTTALLSDHWGDVWSWLGLGAPVAVMARFGLRRDPAPRTTPHLTDTTDPSTGTR